MVKSYCHKKASEAHKIIFGKFFLSLFLSDLPKNQINFCSESTYFTFKNIFMHGCHLSQKSDIIFNLLPLP